MTTPLEDRGRQIAALNEAIHHERAQADRFRRYAATHPRPACPPTPADIADLNPEDVYPSLPSSVLLLFAADCDAAADRMETEMRALIALPQPTRKAQP